MAAKFFGQFLLEKGLLDPAQLLRALEAQRQSNPLLGEIAERLGMLGAADADRINTRQRREDKRFGDLAIEMGLLDAAQVDRLLAEQKAARRLFGEILLDLGVIDAATLEHELALHRAEREAAAHSIELGLSGHPYGELANAAGNIAGTLFGRVLKLPCQVSSLIGRGDDGAPGERLATLAHAAQVAISGDRAFRIALACERETMHTMARGFLGRAAAGGVDDELAQDAFGEFLNIVMGYVVKDRLPIDARYQASPPDFSRDARQLVSADPQALTLLLTSPAGEVAVIVSER